jgi:hypothetical protein
MPIERAGALLEKLFARQGLKRGVRDAQVVHAWSRAVGPELAHLSEARRFTGGVLFVDVSDSETAMHLAMQRRRFMEALNRELGKQTVRDIRFAGRGAVAQPVAQDAQDGPRFGPPGPDDMRAAKTLTSGATGPEGVEAVERTAAAFVVREREAQAAGWVRCVYCQAVIEAGRVCLTCERYERDGRVQRVAERLTSFADAPATALTEDEAHVARAIAAERLLQRAETQLPVALTDARTATEAVAILKRRAALLLNLAPAEVDDTMLQASLDDRLAQLISKLPVDAPSNTGEDET